MSESAIKEEILKIQELREKQMKLSEQKKKNSQDFEKTQKNKLSSDKSLKALSKQELKERERRIEQKRLKKKKRKEKERALKLKQRLEANLKKPESMNEDSDHSKKPSDIEQVEQSTQESSAVETHEENMLQTDDSVVIDKRQSKQTQKKKAFMEALKARQSRRKQLQEFVKKDDGSKVKVVKTSGMIKAKEVVKKSKKVK